MNKIEKYQYYLPTYEECKAICDKYDNFQFYEGVTMVDGYKIATFNYRLIGYNDFISPLGAESPIKSKELRGITYVFNIDGSLYKRFLLMNKFFNLNQVEETQYHSIKHIPIKYVHDKCDGSVISFIELPNGKILSKSKMCVDNNQALWAHEIYESNSEIKKMVSWAFERNIMPIMEFVSPRNRIVLKYKKTDLILLKFRDLTSGEYLDLDIYPDIDKLSTVKTEPYTTWDEMTSLVDTLEDKEGWVVTLENGQMVKIKTKWYCDLHFMIDSLSREDFLIEKVIDEEIDDIIGQIDPDEIELLDLINNIITITNNYIKTTSKKVDEIVKEFHEKYNSNKKDFVYGYGKRDKYFSYTMCVVDGKETSVSIVTKDLKKYIYKLEQARSFIENKDF